MGTFTGFAFLLGFIVINAALMIALTQYFGPRVTGARGRMFETPYECGLEPMEIVRGRLSIKFFLVALLFILFDVELIFLFPWAVVFKDLGLYGFVVMLIFLDVVLAGLYYSIKKGALRWQ